MEFVEVFKQAQRLCNDMELYCGGCPLGNHDGSCQFKPWEDDVNLGEVERRVMEWAKEHPEPQYPTWAELLYQELYQDFLIWCQEKYPGRAKDEKAWFDYIYETPIPADIAVKLGLKPKEANGDG